MAPAKLTETSPDISIVSVEFEDVLKILDSFMEVFLSSKNATDGVHRGD